MLFGVAQGLLHLFLRVLLALSHFLTPKLSEPFSVVN